MKEFNALGPPSMATAFKAPITSKKVGLIRVMKDPELRDDPIYPVEKTSSSALPGHEQSNLSKKLMKGKSVENSKCIPHQRKNPYHNPITAWKNELPSHLKQLDVPLEPTLKEHPQLVKPADPYLSGPESSTYEEHRHYVNVKIYLEEQKEGRRLDKRTKATPITGRMIETE